MEDIVTILMATYNGEEFLVEQLDSIINQTYPNWKLIIRDDCSTDKTASILKKYCSRDSRIDLLNSTERLGAAGNFGSLLEYACNSEYIMFCDQDDVWHREKVQLSLTEITKRENYYRKSCPLLVYTDMDIVDEELNSIYKSPKVYNDTITSLLAQNHIYGCTMIINQALTHQSLPIPSYAQNHDYWIALNASVNGHIHKINISTIFYRQHRNNVTGGVNNFSLKSKIRNWDKTNLLMLKTIHQNLLFCALYKEHDSNILNQYICIFESGRCQRIVKALTFGLCTDSHLGTLRLYFIIFKYSENTLHRK